MNGFNPSGSPPTLQMRPSSATYVSLEPVKEWNACVVDVTSICPLGATLNYDIALAMNQEGRDKEEGSRTQGESELRWRRSQ